MGNALLILITLFVLITGGAEGIRFVIDREECMSHKVEYEGDNVHLSFVVIKSDAPWNSDNYGVDLVVIHYPF